MIVDIFDFIYIIFCMAILRSLIIYTLRRVAGSEVVKAKALDAARKGARKAGEIARDDDPARAMGRAIGRLKKKFKTEK